MRRFDARLRLLLLLSVVCGPIQSSHSNRNCMDRRHEMPFHRTTVECHNRGKPGRNDLASEPANSFCDANNPETTSPQHRRHLLLTSPGATTNFVSSLLPPPATAFQVKA